MAAIMCLCQRVPLCVYVWQGRGVSQAPGAAKCGVQDGSVELQKLKADESGGICISASN